MSQRAALAAGLLSLCACASVGDNAGDRAQHHHEGGDLELALLNTERAILQEPHRADIPAIDLHISLLHDLGRQVEAYAFAHYVSRFRKGRRGAEITGQCTGLSDKLERRKQLIASWGNVRSYSGFSRGPVSVVFDLAADGSIPFVSILTADNPGSAWAAIRAVVDAKIRQARLSRLDKRELPITFCGYIEDEEPPDGHHDPKGGKPDFNIRGKGPGGI